MNDHELTQLNILLKLTKFPKVKMENNELIIFIEGMKKEEIETLTNVLNSIRGTVRMTTFKQKTILLYVPQYGKEEEKKLLEEIGNQITHLQRAINLCYTYGATLGTFSPEKLPIPVIVNIAKFLDHRTGNYLAQTRYSASIKAREAEQGIKEKLFMKR